MVNISSQYRKSEAVNYKDNPHNPVDNKKKSLISRRLSEKENKMIKEYLAKKELISKQQKAIERTLKKEKAINGN